MLGLVTTGHQYNHNHYHYYYGPVPPYIADLCRQLKHQLAADRDSDPPLAATSWLAPPPRTLATMQSLWRAHRHGTSCRWRIYGH